MTTLTFPTSNAVESVTVSGSDERYTSLKIDTFLQMEQKEQAQIVADLSLDDAVRLLDLCPLALARALLDEMESTADVAHARQIASALGIVLSDAETEDTYLKTSVGGHVKERIGWIVGLAILGVFSGLIISHFEDALTQLVLLAVYMPVIAAAGGNTGSQAATLVVRAMALGEVRARDWLKVLWKEARIALIIAAVLAVVIFMRVVIFSSGAVPEGFSLEMISIAICVALAIQVFISTSLGALLPIIARQLKLDPAVLVSPVLASVVDISGLYIYFSCANWLLPLNG